MRYHCLLFQSNGSGVYLIFRRIRTVILDILLLPQAWKEGNYTVAELMSRRITGEY